MNRRQFLVASSCAPLLRFQLSAAPNDQLSWLGKPQEAHVVNLAACGRLKSWIRPATAFENQADTLTLTSGSGNEAQADVGVEWPEFRTLHEAVVRFAGDPPQPGSLFLEYWDGLTALQGSWKPFEAGLINGNVLAADGPAWTFHFQQRRTCKVRIRLAGAQRSVRIAEFALHGPSVWKSGDIQLEWGHAESAPWRGHLEAYNSEILDLRPIGAARVEGGRTWVCAEGQKSGVAVRLLYTWGMDVDRSVLTVRSQNSVCSFLPGEAVEGEPIDIVDHGIYVRKSRSDLDVGAYRERNRGRLRIIDAVAREQEQTIENAYAHIQSRRVTLSFVGSPANNQKFGIAPDGHLVVASGDPLSGNPMTPKFAVYFDTAEQPFQFEPPSPPQNLFANDDRSTRWVDPKTQHLKDGWLPVLTTHWSQNDLAFERTDLGTLVHLDKGEEELIGDEPAILISQLKIRNSSPDEKLASYYIRPWKPLEDSKFSYGPIPANVSETWKTGLRTDLVTASSSEREYVVCLVDQNHKGDLELDPTSNSVRYQVRLQPGEQHVIQTIIPGWPSAIENLPAVRGVQYDTHQAAVSKYWSDRVAQSMRIRIPDRRLQNLFDATLQHFLLVLTKNGHKRECYPNVAMLHYGSIGSESSPIIRALDMRGLHDIAEQCLDAFLSTQSEFMPEGDYGSKEGGFYRFWPIYTVDQGGVLWALADHYEFTRDDNWLRRVAPKLAAGCDFIVRERRRGMQSVRSGEKPLTYGLAPAGCVADPRDWQYSFMLNGWFCAGLSKAARVLAQVDSAKAASLMAEAADYRECILRAFRESVALSPVTRLRDNTSVSSAPPYLGLQGFSTDVKDSVDPDRRHGYAYDCTIGPFHLFNCNVLSPEDPLVTAMLNYLEDRFFLFTPLPSRVNLDQLATDWFNLGGFEKLQPYYVHYQEAYLRRDQIPNFLRGFYNTVASIADPETLTFQEELDFGGGQPHKTHEEAWFFHQARNMLVMEEDQDLYLARGTPRVWLSDGQEIAIDNAPTYFGIASYRIQSSAGSGSISGEVHLASKGKQPSRIVLRLRHPDHKPLTEVRVNGQPWTKFDRSKEQIELPIGPDHITFSARY